MDRGKRKARPVDARRPRHGQAPNTEDKERARRWGATRCFESVLKSWKVWPFSDDFGMQLLLRVRLWVRQMVCGGVLRCARRGAARTRRMIANPAAQVTRKLRAPRAASRGTPAPVEWRRETAARISECPARSGRAGSRRAPYSRCRRCRTSWAAGGR